MLSLSAKSKGACAAILCAVLLAACSQDSSLDDGSEQMMAHAEGPPMMVDASKTQSTPFADLTLEHCLGRPDVANDAVQTADCSEPGAFEILGISTIGEGAPAEKPDGVTMDQFAIKTCNSFYEAWAEETGEPVMSLFNIIVISDEWNGAATSLACGGRQ